MKKLYKRLLGVGVVGATFVGSAMAQDASPITDAFDTALTEGKAAASAAGAGGIALVLIPVGVLLTLGIVRAVGRKASA